MSSRRFADRYRVVAVDHIGCGDSDKPSRKEFSYRLADHQDNLARLIENLDLRNVMLLAHDWGGAIGLGALLKTLRAIFRDHVAEHRSFPAALRAVANRGLSNTGARNIRSPRFESLRPGCGLNGDVAKPLDARSLRRTAQALRQLAKPSRDRRFRSRYSDEQQRANLSDACWA